jgi:hypothetical protein
MSPWPASWAARTKTGVAVEGPGAGHAVAAHFQREELPAGLDHRGRARQEFPGGGGGAGGDLPDQGTSTQATGLEPTGVRMRIPEQDPAFSAD